MINKFNYKALTLARESRGYTQSELSEVMNYPQSSLSKIENGALGVDEDFIKTVSQSLNYPESFFYQDVNIYPPNLHYRKKASTSAKTLSTVEANMNIYRENIQILLNSVDIPFSSMPYVKNANQYNLARDVAKNLRQYWHLPKGSIDNLVELMENKGIIIILMDFGTDKIDGRSMTTEKGQFIIFLNKDLSGDRQRYTLAHELAHIILHIYSPTIFETDIEKEAMEFASEFLMPEIEIKPQLTGSKLTLQKLADLKRYWKVSMQAILYWAETLKMVTTNQARYLWSQFNSLRIRFKEPIDIPNEKPSLLLEIINTFLNQLGYSKKELADTLHLSVVDFDDRYFSMNKNLLRVVR